MVYHEVKFTLTEAQKKKLAHAHVHKQSVTLRLSKENISNNGVPLLLTEGEVKKINGIKAHDIIISASRIKQLEKHGGFLSAILPYIPTILGALASLTGIGSNIKTMVTGNGLKTHHMCDKCQGRGFLSDLVGNIPLLGGIVSPMLKNIGLGLKKKRAKKTKNQHAEGLYLSKQ